MDALQEEILKKFGEHVKKIRLESGLTQDEVVLNSSKLTKGTVSDIENGKRNFAFTTLIDLAKGLNISPSDLMNFTIEKS
ncbi:helix-turn-helix transcriptional regulator [uncultured Chryseobacterium sp.]|uniref:helix-turn-helix domain-containing protein n=1 Tax=uncultured Chryseobacterium sp. TaxID=259322 RepID=UPI0025FF34B1|nr:helix-turn-helix transcriptional regulator [uncultured Chryseobacterium sp.]